MHVCKLLHVLCMHTNVRVFKLQLNLCPRKKLGSLSGLIITIQEKEKRTKVIETRAHMKGLLLFCVSEVVG